MVAAKHNKMKHQVFYRIFVHLILLTLCYGDITSTPLMFWKHDGSEIDGPVLPSGRAMKAEDVFKTYLQPTLKEGETVLIFLQDELSLDDLTKSQDSFHYLKQVSTDYNSFIVPSLIGQSRIIEKFINHYPSANIHRISSFELPSWKPAETDVAGKLFIFSLSPVAGVVNKADVFKENTLLMKHTITMFAKLSVPYSVVYTAMEPSPFVSSILAEEIPNDQSLVSRHLLSAENNSTGEVKRLRTGTLFKNGCVYMFASSIMFNTIELIDATWKVAGTCGKGVMYTISLTKEGEKVNDISDFNLLLHITVSSNTSQGEWSLKSIVVSYKINGNSNTTTYNCNGSSQSSGACTSTLVPMSMSFSCNVNIFKSENNNLTIENLQLQPLMNNADGFSSAYSCIGFFSIEILTAIFITIILALGLIIGIGMIMAIQTQDRFDDPKGKSISVPTTE